MKKYVCLFLFTSVISFAQASDPYPRNPAIDVVHYQFQLKLSDQNNEIEGDATVEVRFVGKPVSEFQLDLVGKLPGENTGMTISSITSDGKPIAFTHEGDRIRLQLATPAQAEEHRSFRIVYQGIPEDGLIISNNQYGDRTFFGDNWPNRAHYWLPTVDHPSDKATCEFTVISPKHYQVIANGLKVKESDVDDTTRLIHWKEAVPIATKVMVIGVARFAIQTAGEVKGKAVQSWVFPQNKEAGFHDYALAVSILQFMEERLGPFAYEKLANVQSKTRYGGMENASCIFYDEKTITGNRDSEPLLAHEIAHQWFGDSASELDWYHIWLSEGFATYMTQVYLEAIYGRERLVKGMKDAQTKVMDYYQNTPNAPIVDTTVTDLNKLLNPNSYEKAAWVLHMLRHKLGDEPFFRGIRAYYQQYRDKNALTIDFQNVMEKAAGKNLDLFFKQWLFQPGQPMLQGSWQYDKANKKLVIQLKQTQKGPLFNIPLEVGIYDREGKLLKLATVEASKRDESFTIPLPFIPASV
ncbi:MAG: M1 family aminopeptidase, partial [Bacteroidota bacterium]